ncbi:MAG: polyprenyl synthetase family protein [Myxococcales bacterium]
MNSLDESAQFLQAIEENLARLLPSEADDDMPLLQAARRLTLAPGAKRLRPRMVWAAAECLGAGSAGLVQAATTAELTHGASLLHDDVVDEGTVRRGRPTANVTFGNAVAVLAGDLLLSVALEQLEGHPPSLLRSAIQVVRKMSQASMREISSRGRLDLGLSDWRQIAEGKTGELFGWCCAAPARLIGRTAEAESLRRCGRHLGVAFQMADDLLDLLPGPHGKDRFSDLRERTPSFPMLLGIAASPSLRDRIAAFWAGPEREPAALGAALLDLGVAPQTERAIERELDEARTALGGELRPLVDRITSLWASPERSREILSEAV